MFTDPRLWYLSVMDYRVPFLKDLTRIFVMRGAVVHIEPAGTEFWITTRTTDTLDRVMSILQDAGYNVAYSKDYRKVIVS